MADLMMQSKSGEFVAKKAIPVGYKMTEVGVIPEDWDVVSVSSLISSIGSGVSVNSVDKINAFSHGMHVLKTSCVSEGEFLPDEKKSILPSDIHRAKCSPSKGDIIVSRMNTPMLVGELGYVSVDIEDSFLPDRLWLMKFKNSGDVNSRWLSLLLSSSSFSKKIKESATGTSGSMKNISKETFLAMLVPKPAFKEQAIIATTLADTDSLIAGLDQLVAKKQAFKTATMQQLLTGRTRLPQFALRPDGTPKGYKSSELGQIPEDWKVLAIDDCATKVGSGKTPNGGASVYLDAGRPFVRSQNIGWGKLILDDVAYISDDIHNTFSGSEIKEGDVLLNITGASIGRCAITEEYIVGGNVNQHVCIIRLNSVLLNARLLVELINSRNGQKQIDSYQAGGNREGLNFQQVRQLKFAVSNSSVEQTAIATILSDMDNELNALEQKLAKARDLKQGIMQQLLTGRIRLPLPQEA